MNILEIKNLSFTYSLKNTPALDNLSFSVDEGEFVVIMGESGAGKSSLFFAIQRIIPYFFQGNIKGNIYFKGKDIIPCGVQDVAGEIGLVFQDFEMQLFSTSVELEVAFLPSNLGVLKDEIKKRVKMALDLTGLCGFERRNPATLSGGEKQRLAIASILSGMPSLVLLDEVTSDLDPLGKEEIFKLSKLLKNKYKTVIMIEHESENLSFADRICLMRKGKILKEGTPQDILKDVELLIRCGIRPPFLSLLFNELNINSSFEDAYSILKKEYLIVNENYKKLNRHEEDNFEPIIEVKNLSFSYDGTKDVLKNVNLTIKKGEIVGIIGQNGSGKTTLAKHLNCLLLPTKGEVKVKGRQTTKQKLSDIAKVVGYVFQNPDNQIFADTVYDEVSFGPRNLGLHHDEVKQRVKEALISVGLSGYENEDPFSLTKGERQRVAVASILAHRPEILIFDEPTTGLDWPHILKMMELITNLNKNGYTVIIITHCMWVVAEYCKRCIVMKDGEIILDGKTRDVFSHTNKEKLYSAKITLPSCVELSHRFGITLLSLFEWKSVLKKRTCRQSRHIEQ